MSGILLPGQENQPQQQEDESANETGSGLILPKGYGSHKRTDEPADSQPLEQDEAVEEANKSGSGTDGTSEADVQVPGNEQRELNFKYPPSGAQVQCPSCSTPYTTPIFTIVDLEADPQLKSPLLSGQINMAICPSCNTAGQLSVPLMVHIPEESFLAVYLPQGGGLDDLQSQKIIGNLTQTLMRDRPTEQRKGYMLQPQQFFDWNRMLEKIWGFDGVTPEMLRRRSDQSALMQNLLRIGNDDTALKLAIERSSDLIDREFFGLLEQMALTLDSQGQGEAAQGIMVLFEKLLEMSDAGKEISATQERVREVISQITPQTTRAELLDMMIDAWSGDEGLEIVAGLAAAAGPALDYEFLMELASRIEQTGSAEETQRLEELREAILAVQERQKQSQQALVQQLQAVLQEVLQSEDTEAALRERADFIDENFLGILSANIQAAQQQNASAAARRLQTVYQQAMGIFQEQMPPEVKFIQQLMAAPDASAAKKILQENRSMITKEFIETMSMLEQQMRDTDNSEPADRLKSLRGQAKLML